MTSAFVQPGEEGGVHSDLLRSALGGDGESLGLLLESHRPYIYARALQLTRSRAVAEDAVQDTFVIALTRLSQLRRGESLRSWLYAVVTNVCLAGLRRRSSAEEQLAAERRLKTQQDLLLGDEYVQGAAQKDLVWRALLGLGEELRLAVILRYFSDFHSYDEVARILGVPVGTVRSRLSAAKVQLLRLLEGGAPGGRAAFESSAPFDSANLRAMWASLWRRELGRFGRYFHDELDFTFVFADGSVSTERGLKGWQGEVHGDIEAGTYFVPDSAFSSGNLCVVEGEIRNAPETPFRCPPGGSAVLVHDGKRIKSMRIYMAQRPDF